MLRVYSTPPLLDLEAVSLMSGSERRASTRGLGRGGQAHAWGGSRGAEHRLGFSRRRRTRWLRTVEAPSWEGRGSYLSQAESELPRGCHSDGNSRQVQASHAISFAGSLPGGSGSRLFVRPPGSGHGLDSPAPR